MHDSTSRYNKNIAKIKLNRKEDCPQALYEFVEPTSDACEGVIFYTLAQTWARVQTEPNIWTRYFGGVGFRFYFIFNSITNKGGFRTLKLATEV